MTQLDDEAQELYLIGLLNAGCKMKYRTIMFGKEYVAMTDPHGKWFFERVPSEQDV